MCCIYWVPEYIIQMELPRTDISDFKVSKLPIRFNSMNPIMNVFH